MLSSLELSHIDTVPSSPRSLSSWSSLIFLRFSSCGHFVVDVSGPVAGIHVITSSTYENHIITPHFLHYFLYFAFSTK